MCHDSPLIGPDFIEQLAERQLQNGLETDAAALRGNAESWRTDRRALEAYDRENAMLRDQLQAADRRFAEIQRAATVQL